MCYISDMTTKTATIHARILPSLKEQAEAVLAALGMTTSEAISIYFSQIALHKGLPFDVKIPNKTTRKAMAEAKKGKTRLVASVDDLMRDLNA